MQMVRCILVMLKCMSWATGRRHKVLTSQRQFHPHVTFAIPDCASSKYLPKNAKTRPTTKNMCAVRSSCIKKVTEQVA